MCLFRNYKSGIDEEKNKYSEMLQEMIRYYDCLNKITDCLEYWHESNEEMEKNIRQCEYYQGHVELLSEAQKELIKKVYDNIISSMLTLSANMFEEYSSLRKKFKDLELMSNDEYKRLWYREEVSSHFAGGYNTFAHSVTINLLSLFDDKSKYSNEAYKKLYFKESGLTSEPTNVNKKCLSAIYLTAFKKKYLTTLDRFHIFSTTPCPPFQNTVRIPNYYLGLLNDIIKYYENNSIDNINNIFYYVYEFQAKKHNVKYDKNFINKINQYFGTTETLIKLINNNYKYVSLIDEIDKYNKMNN